MPISNMENQNSSSYLNKTMEHILKNLSSVNRPGAQININQNPPLKINTNEVGKEKRDLWEHHNIDKNTDKME